MAVGKNESKVKIEIDQIDSFQYLGVNIHKDGKEYAEINKRLERTKKLHYALNNKYIYIKYKNIKKNKNNGI